jgi:phosphoribosylformylglycinamidine cyclo-ligase
MHAGIWDAIRKTHMRSAYAPLPIYGHYAGFVDFGQHALAMHTDGVGTKVLVAQALRRFDTVGIDCVAMNANDVVCTGAEPVALVDYIALEREDDALVAALLKGLVEGANQAGCAIVGGETAIMPDVIKGENGTGFDLAATCLGVVEKAKIITGERMKPGDAVIALRSSGIHSNGLTLARKVLGTDKAVLKELLTPTAIYVKPVLEAARRLDVRGIAHITGGAFSKASRITERAGVGMLLQMPKMPAIFSKIRDAGVSNAEMYRTFNCGIGMLVAVPQSDARDAVRLLGDAFVAGSVTKERGIAMATEGGTVRFGSL